MGKARTEKSTMKPIHPGEILLHDFMEPMGISAYRLAADLGVTAMRISNLVRHKIGISADTAMRLGRYFDTGPRWWMNMQVNYELEVARRRIGKAVIRQVKPPKKAA